MGCGLSSDPLLADIYNEFEQKYQFETIFPSDPSQPTKQNSSETFGHITPLLEDNEANNAQSHYISDSDIDVNNNSANLSDSSSPLDVLIDLNQKTSKLIIRLTQYNGSELRPIINLGLNQNKNSPQRQNASDNNSDDDENDTDLILKANNRGLIIMELILSHFVRSCSLNVAQLCPQKFFPNDIKSMIISFYSVEHPKLASFRVIVPTAKLCKYTMNSCNYIGTMLSKKLLIEPFVNDSEINNAQQINAASTN